MESSIATGAQRFWSYAIAAIGVARQDAFLIVIALGGAIIGYQIWHWIYNLYFHPLTGFPGPKLWGMSRITREFVNLRGDIPKQVYLLHEKYGEIVRVAPNVLSFINPDAWTDIYVHKSRKPPFIKDPVRYTHELWINGAPEVFTSLEKDHTRLRRLIQPAFSDKAIREQESLIQATVDLLILRLQEQIDTHKGLAVVDINQWMNWTTFDAIGDLSFGETFSCLENGGYHPWVAMITNSIRRIAFNRTIKQWPYLHKAWSFLIGPLFTRALKRFHGLIIEKVDRRLATETQRKDFIKFLLEHKDLEKQMTKDELYSNAGMLIMAGSETSSMALSGAIYHLAKYREFLGPLQEEIRSKFSNDKNITFKAVTEMPRLLAVLHESMRLYPPQADIASRVVPKGGAMVAGRWIPEGAKVGLYQPVAYSSPKNFRDPQRFDPSRWLGNPIYENDRREVYRPFSIGRKDCIGKQLAYSEMQVILAKILWNFNIDLVDKRQVWTDQKVHWIWIRGPLMIKVTKQEVAKG